MKETLKFALVGVLFAAAPLAGASESNCNEVVKITNSAIAQSPDKVLDVVAKLVTKHKDCSCEVVKAAIIATEADKELVGKIVEVAVKAAPEQLSLISTCALVVAPDAQAEIVSVVSKHSQSAGGDYSAKADYSAKGKEPLPMAAVKANPLDFPGVGPIGPELGSTGGTPLLPFGLPPQAPPVTPVSATR
ncbi:MULTISPECIES: hypothetical protein [Rubritalea]|nr:hypothetical protein [Rubritalea squalenifaciens]